MSPIRHAILEAAREFNAGRFFEAHEAIEEVLDDTPDALWELHLGLIRIAVGYHKVSQGLWSGAERMLMRGLETMEAYPDTAGEVELAQLRARARRDAESLRRGRYAEVDLVNDPPRLQPTAARRSRAPDGAR